MKSCSVALVVLLIAAVFNTALIQYSFAKQVVIVALGASNTRGKGVSRPNAYPAHLEAMLRTKGIPAHVINAGINGNTTGQMLARLSIAVPLHTRVVILQSGGNDFRRGISRQRYRLNIKKIKRRLKARGTRVVMLRNRLIKLVARTYPRPDGQHFKSAGYYALAAKLLPEILGALQR